MINRHLFADTAIIIVLLIQIKEKVAFFTNIAKPIKLGL